MRTKAIHLGSHGNYLWACKKCRRMHGSYKEAARCYDKHQKEKGVIYTPRGIRIRVEAKRRKRA